MTIPDRRGEEARRIAARIAAEDFPLVREKPSLPDLPHLDGLPLVVQAYLNETHTVLASLVNGYAALLQQNVGLHRMVLEAYKAISEDAVRQKVEKIHGEKMAEFSQALDHANRILKALTDAAEEAKAADLKTFTKVRRSAAVRA